jgi:prepilin-type N-terminal cleavage/methylation domain-containing protein
MKKSAFTLIELLVVIAIIGILSLSVFTILESARTDARATNALQMLQQIKKAFHVDYANQVSYPTEAELGLSNPSINTLVDQGYLPSLSEDLDYRLFGQYTISYDNDGGARAECASNFSGVNLIAGPEADIIEAIEKVADGEDGACGQIRSVDNALLYNIQLDSSKFP